jgi:hypothetical protein
MGEVRFLVHGECGCGWTCACPEGAIWPECPMCGEQVLPPRPVGPGEPGERQGYVAELLPEPEALEHVTEVRAQGRIEAWL